MAENQLSSLMQVEVPAPGRANFNRGYINRFTASMGYGYPAMVLEVLPNTRVRCGLDSLIKSDPLVSSLYGTIRQSWQAYFIPSRLYVKELDQNHRLGISPEELENCRFPVVAQSAIGPSAIGTANSKFAISTPKTEAIPDTRMISAFALYNNSEHYDTRNFGVVPAGGLLDMLGMYPANFEFEQQISVNYNDNDFVVFDNIVKKGINAIPLIGYYDIYRNYYQNQQELNNFLVQYETNDSVSLHNVQTGFDIHDFLRSLDTHIFSVYERRQDVNLGDNYDNHFNILGIDAWRELFASLLNFGTWQEVTSGVFANIENPLEDMGVFELGNRVHSGYWRRCYDDDYFTSKLASNYIDQLDTTARVTVSNNAFSVQQFRLASRNYRYTKKNTLANSQRYDDWLDVHYGAKLNRALNIPHFLGSMSTEFYFDDIYATAQTGASDNGSLGDRSGVLNTSARTGEFFDFEAEEHGYVIVVFSLIPRVDYFGGTKKMYLKDSLADVYKPEFDAVGFQDIYAAEIQGLRGHWNRSMGKQVSWFEYMTNYNELHGLFTQSDRSFMTLARVYDPYRYDEEIQSSYSSYIEPWDFQNIFQETASWKDNFYVQARFDVTCYQPMSKQIVTSW